MRTLKVSAVPSGLVHFRGCVPRTIVLGYFQTSLRDLTGELYAGAKALTILAFYGTTEVVP
jgi:hypothetical protein